MQSPIKSNINKYSVSVVVPNWNGEELLKKHFRKVVEFSDNAQVIVSDDCSTDSSVAFLKNNFSDVLIVSNNERRGFSGNVNNGVSYATGDIIVLLNTDVEPEHGYLNYLISYFSDPEVFAVGCKEKSFEKGRIVLRGRGLGHWEKGYYLHSRGEVDGSDTAWVSGGSGAFRKSIWVELGGLDQVYSPFYWEDIDLSYRARKRGYRIVFAKDSMVNHYHQEGKIRKHFSTSEIKRISYRNQYIFIWKNVTDPKIILEHIIWMPLRLFQAVIRKDWSMIYGFYSALASLRLLIIYRWNNRHIKVKPDNSLDVIV